MSRSHAVYGGHHIKQSRLSRSGSPHDSHEFSLCHLETDPVYGLRHIGAIPVIFFHVAHAYIVIHIPVTPFSLIL